MLSNPVYTGRVAWGKRRTEKVPGKDNEYRLVKQDEYILSEVISHEAFVSKEDFDKVITTLVSITRICCPVS